MLHRSFRFAAIHALCSIKTGLRSISGTILPLTILSEMTNSTHRSYLQFARIDVVGCEQVLVGDGEHSVKDLLIPREPFSNSDFNAWVACHINMTRVDFSFQTGTPQPYGC